MKQDLSSRGLKRYELFVIVSMAGTISFFAYALLAGASAFDWLCIDNFGGFEFGDYFQHVFFMQDAKHLYVNASGGCSVAVQGVDGGRVRDYHGVAMKETQ